jgi:hypothetical protein
LQSHSDSVRESLRGAQDLLAVGMEARDIAEGGSFASSNLGVLPFDAKLLLDLHEFLPQFGFFGVPTEPDDPTHEQSNALNTKQSGKAG